MRARSREDGAIEFLRSTHRVVFAFKYRRLVIEPMTADPHEASTVRTYPFEAVREIVVRRLDDGHELLLRLRSGDELPLAAEADSERAMRLAWAIGNAVRCGIELDADDALPLARQAIDAELLDLDDVAIG